MECKLSEENIILEKKLTLLNKDLDSWRDQVKHQEELQRKWCDDLEKKLNDLGYIADPHVDAAIHNALDDLSKYKEQLNIKIEKNYGRCTSTHCRKYMSTDWDFCPYCGNPRGTKVSKTINDLFEAVEKDLPITNETKDQLFQWRVRWAWIKRCLIEGQNR